VWGDGGDGSYPAEDGDALPSIAGQEMTACGSDRIRMSGEGEMTTCNDCRYWQASGHYDVGDGPLAIEYGWCRRCAPVRGEWPYVACTAWCGEAETKEPSRDGCPVRERE
jgi:hypothetical protein